MSGKAAMGIMLLYRRRVTTYEFMIGAQWFSWRFTHCRSARAAGCSSFRVCSWLLDGVQLSRRYGDRLRSPGWLAWSLEARRLHGWLAGLGGLVGCIVGEMMLWLDFLATERLLTALGGFLAPFGGFVTAIGIV